MKNGKKVPADLSDALSVFTGTLPDPDKCYHSTIKDEVSVNDQKITFFAQKTKGEKGMCWDIRYKIAVKGHLPD